MVRALQCPWNLRNPNARHRLLKQTTITQQGWKPASAQRACWTFPVDLAIYTLTSTCTYGYQFKSDHSSHNTNSRASLPHLFWSRYVDSCRRGPCPAPSSDTKLLHSSDKFHHPSYNSTGPAGDTNPSMLQQQQGCSSLEFRKRSIVAKQVTHLAKLILKS